MFINGLYLDRYKYFKFSDIRELVWSEVGKISNIQGRNGSGKSTLLKRLLPLPGTKSDFTINGKARGGSRIELTHDNIDYILTSDFSDQRIHSFMRDNEELNISGTTGIQQELIEKHLGLDNSTCKLLTIAYKFSAMPPSGRKMLLTSLNPMNMTLVLNKHKAVQSKLKGYKNTLTLLYQRREEVSNQVLRPEVLREMIRNKEILEEQKNALNLWKYSLVEHIDKLRTHIPKSKLNIDDTLSDLTTMSFRSMKYYEVSRDAYSDEIIKLTSNQYSVNREIETIKTDILQIIEELDKYERYLKDTPSDKIRSMLEDRITELEKHIAGFEIQDGYIGASVDEVNTISAKRNEIIEILQTFVENNLKDIDPTLDLVSLDQKVQKRREQYQYTRNRITDLKTTLEPMLERVKCSQVSIPKNCPTTTCELFVVYNKNMQGDEEQIKKIQTELDKLEPQLVKLKKSGIKLSDTYNTLKDFNDRYNKLIRIVSQELSGLFHIIKDITPTNLNNQPLYILNKIDDHIVISKLIHERDNMIVELNKCRKELLDANSKDRPSLDLLKELISTHRSKLETKRKELTVVEQQYVQYTERLAIFKQYEADRKYIDSLQTNIERALYDKELECSLSYYEKLLTAFNRIATDIDMKLYELDKTVQEQNRLKDRLDNEISHLIKESENAMSKLSILEQALSPASGLPHKYMTDFLNSIIKNANILISKVFTYPFNIYKLSYNNPLTYKFRVKIGDEQTADISECSKGQREMIDLALNLACIIQADLTDYPIYVDEVDSALDPIHKQELLNLFAYLIENNIVTQLFMCIHNSGINTGINGDNILLGDENVLNVETFNEHVEIKKY